MKVRSLVRHALLVLPVLSVLSSGACAEEEPARSQPTARPSVRAEHRDEVAVARAFVRAANRGDADAVKAAFAPNARFDSVGRIYRGRDDIYAAFLGPEVIEAGGRYREISARSAGDRVVLGYDYDTGHGGRETFTYAYRIQDGAIVDVVGRYIERSR